MKVTYVKSGTAGHRTFEAHAPEGYAFDTGERLHMLVEHGDGNAQTEREALADLKKRVAEAPLVECPADCDCRDEEPV